MTGRRHGIRSLVAASIEQFGENPFTLSTLAETAGLPRDQVFSVLYQMQRAGVVRVVGEQREEGRPGRGQRVYVASLPSEGSAARPGATEAVQRVREAVQTLSSQFDFSTTDLVRVSEVPRETVRWVLEVLEREGVVCRLIEMRPSEIGSRGRPSQRWTSSPENIAAQNQLLQRMREIEGW